LRLCLLQEKRRPSEEGLIGGANLHSRGRRKATMRPRRTHPARKAPRRTPPHRTRVGLGLPWCVRRRIRGCGEGKEGPAPHGKIPSFGKEEKRESEREREGEARRGEVNGME
ncbi:hypothetical protein BAE44_0006869, partial [Dichanthelium oligosanthes]